LRCSTTAAGDEEHGRIRTLYKIIVLLSFSLTTTGALLIEKIKTEKALPCFNSAKEKNP